MTTHGSVAKKARLAKQQRPGDYCKAAGCLWRTYNANTGVTTPCDRHDAKALRRERDYKSDGFGCVVRNEED